MNIQNLNNLLNEALEIEREEACKVGALGYMARFLIQSSMPHSQVEGHEFKRRNGAFKLVILADSEVGLPFGSLPRLLLSWITTEAVKTNRRELILGKTLSDFMAELDLTPSGGRWGGITRLKNQMKRLFSASISCTYDNGESWGIHNVMPVEKAELWWDPKRPTQTTMWESKLLLGETFFNEITNNPVPIDMRALKSLKQSPMALDIYCWLTYRMSYLKKITFIPWSVLELQFGANYKDLRQFKRRFLNQLKKVLLIYSEAKIRETPKNLVLFPSKPHIQKQNKIFATNSNDSVKEEKVITDKLKEYSEYRLNVVIEIVENLKNTSEKYSLLKNFDHYLSRKNLHNIRGLIIKGIHSKEVKEELYNFINSHYHHLLDSIKPYSEYCLSD